MRCAVSVWGCLEGCLRRPLSKPGAQAVRLPDQVIDALPVRRPWPGGSGRGRPAALPPSSRHRLLKKLGLARGGGPRPRIRAPRRLTHPVRAPGRTHASVVHLHTWIWVLICPPVERKGCEGHGSVR